MQKLEIVHWREREQRLGSWSQNQLVIDCNLEPDGRAIEIVLVLRDGDNVEDLARSIEFVINAGNAAIENMQ